MSRQATDLRLNALTAQVKDLQKELWKATSPMRIRELAAQTYADEEARLTKLRDDAVNLLQLLVKKDLISQDELNEAIR